MLLFDFLWTPEIKVERGTMVTGQIGLLWDVVLTVHKCCLLGHLYHVLLSPILITHGQA